MHLEFVQNVKDYIEDELLRVETYKIDAPTPFLPETISSKSVLSSSIIKSIIPKGNDDFELTFFVERNGDFVYELRKGSLLKVNLRLQNNNFDVTTKHVVVEIMNVSSSEVTFRIVLIEVDVEDYED